MTTIAYTPPPLITRPIPTNPLTIQLKGDEDLVRLQTNVDYIIQLPPVVRRSGLKLIGGRTRLVVGGYLSTGAGHTEPNITILDGAPGAVTHLEGLLIDGRNGGRSDAFHLQCPETNVQIYRCRVDDLNGALSDTHADVIQNLGCNSLRVQRFTGRSHYNSVYQRRENDPVVYPVGPSYFYKANFGGYPTNPDAGPHDPQRTLRALSIGTQPIPPSDPTSEVNGLLSSPVWLYEYYSNMEVEAGVSKDQQVWPHAGSRMNFLCRAEVSADGTYIDWPLFRATAPPPHDETKPSSKGVLGSGDAQVYGVVKFGMPPGGVDYVQAAHVGLNYKRLGS